MALDPAYTFLEMHKIGDTFSTLDFIRYCNDIGLSYDQTHRELNRLNRIRRRGYLTPVATVKDNNNRLYCIYQYDRPVRHVVLDEAYCRAWDNH